MINYRTFFKNLLFQWSENPRIRFRPDPLLCNLSLEFGSGSRDFRTKDLRTRDKKELLRDPQHYCLQHCIFNSFVVVDPRNVDAHPALAILSVAEPDPACHCDANLDQAFLCRSDFNVDYDPDPASQNTTYLVPRVAEPDPDSIGSVDPDQYSGSGSVFRIRITKVENFMF